MVSGHWFSTVINLCLVYEVTRGRSPTLCQQRPPNTGSDSCLRKLYIAYKKTIFSLLVIGCAFLFSNLRMKFHGTFVSFLIKTRSSCKYDELGWAQLIVLTAAWFAWSQGMHSKKLLADAWFASLLPGVVAFHFLSQNDQLLRSIYTYLKLHIHR